MLYYDQWQFATTTSSAEALGDAVLSLFSGKCEFDLLHGINYYPGPLGFDFEEGVNSGEAWSSWNGIPPLITEDEALCGRHSLYVSVCRGLTYTFCVCSC